MTAITQAVLKKKHYHHQTVVMGYQKISENEWKVRKAASLARKRANSRRHMSERWKNSSAHRDARRLYMATYRAEKRAAAVARETARDIEAIQTNGIRRKKSHHKICPVLRYDPIVYAAAKKDLKRTIDGRRDPATIRENIRQWRRQHPAAVSAQRFRRRTHLQNPSADLTESQWQAINLAYRKRCAYCGERKPLTQDHVVPISQGGFHTASNIVPACRSCNSSKGVGRPRVEYQPHLIA